MIMYSGRPTGSKANGRKNVKVTHSETGLFRQNTANTEVVDIRWYTRLEHECRHRQETCFSMYCADSPETRYLREEADHNQANSTLGIKMRRDARGRKPSIQISWSNAVNRCDAHGISQSKSAYAVSVQND